MKTLLAAFALLLAAVLPAAAQENTLVMETPHGEVVIELRPDLAPQHAERLRTLTSRGFYDDVPFHRVITNFMAQTGDPTGTGTGGSDLPDIEAEFTNTPFRRGSIGMARTQDPNSANSQFFIVYDRAEWLDGQYTYVGDVVSGMEAIDALAKGVGQSGMVPDPDRIVSMRVGK
ncbi:peptidylprolyl isomerase [Salinarimonas rosea]|uniref:peptidylprolyl isomerase n=1 Tax=Salinarimonas rosea TaxID=552063 RepID=UPI0004191743|nr:peptidylprolyl isomerase [Salinarimonas rosea]